MAAARLKPGLSPRASGRPVGRPAGRPKPSPKGLLQRRLEEGMASGDLPSELDEAEALLPGDPPPAPDIDEGFADYDEVVAGDEDATDERPDDDNLVLSWSGESEEGPQGSDNQESSDRTTPHPLIEFYEEDGAVAGRLPAFSEDQRFLRISTSGAGDQVVLKKTEKLLRGLKLLAGRLIASHADCLWTRDVYKSSLKFDRKETCLKTSLDKSTLSVMMNKGFVRLISGEMVRLNSLFPLKNDLFIRLLAAEPVYIPHYPDIVSRHLWHSEGHPAESYPKNQADMDYGNNGLRPFEGAPEACLLTQLKTAVLDLTWERIKNPDNAQNTLEMVDRLGKTLAAGYKKRRKTMTFLSERRFSREHVWLVDQWTRSAYGFITSLRVFLKSTPDPAEAARMISEDCIAKVGYYLFNAGPKEYYFNTISSDFKDAPDWFRGYLDKCRARILEIVIKAKETS